MKESPNSRTFLTAKQAAGITAEAISCGVQTKAEQVLLNIHKQIREYASRGVSTTRYDLFEGGLKGLPIAEAIRKKIIDSLVESGYTLKKDDPRSWHLSISWEK